jgi:hypothetical protein
VQVDGVWLCGIHAGLVGDPRELGKRSGEKRRRKRGSFRAAVKTVLERDPEAYAERLLSSGPAGIRLAHELVDEEENREQQAPAASSTSTGPRVTMADMLTFALAEAARGNRSIVKGLFELEPTEEQMRAALERERERKRALGDPEEAAGAGDSPPGRSSA